MVEVSFNTSSIDDYRKFLRLKTLPSYGWRGEFAVVPDQYAEALGEQRETSTFTNYEPSVGLFDYQGDIAKLAIRKERFAVFADCGLGKTLILLEFARYAADVTRKPFLIVAPLMVCRQIASEASKFYRETIPVVAAADLPEWLATGSGVAITNYEAIKDGLDGSRLGGIGLDESSMLKSHYGKWGTRLIDLASGCRFRLACTGTPAPNDRIEFANHAVFLGHCRTVNEFLARFFVNRGETANRWELKPHALRPFYTALSHWCIFLANPATYGWKDNVENIPPIHVHIDDVPLTDEQLAVIHREFGTLGVPEAGGIGARSKLSQLAKGVYKKKRVATNKWHAVVSLVASWPREQTIIWARYNDEQDQLAALFPDAANISGSTPIDRRQEMIAEFQAGKRRVLISKPKILGFGLNLQCATRQVFSTLQDSYEEFYQAVKRSNRIGSTRPLNVHIPVTELERPMIETVLSKASRVASDAEEQEAIFKESARV